MHDVVDPIATPAADTPGSIIEEVGERVEEQQPRVVQQ
jgi:hypothetical protein